MDLFQGLLLGLVALTVILLAAVLATLGGVRKALEQRGPETADRIGDIGLGSAYADRSHDVAPAAAQRSEPEPSPSATASSGAGPGQADTIRGVLQQHGLQGTQESSGAPSAAAQEPQQTVESAFAAHADDPQEEPFQRDGRWWFRRGNELLLYDETTGQWQPTGEGASGTGGATQSSGTTQTQPVANATPAVADQVGTYWKCPTCGAVNGSTAATCRMCFAARP